MKRKWYLIETAGLFAADQLLKTYAEQNLDKKEERKAAGPVVIRRVNNRGLSLGLLSGNQTAVKALSLTAATVVTLYQAVALIRQKGFWRKNGLCFLSAGAWSNTFDRFARGYVVDYIGFNVSKPEISKITYNLGDFFIAIGAGILCVCSMIHPWKKTGSEPDR